MCLTIINPAVSWFEIVELPVTEEIFSPLFMRSKKDKTHKETKTKDEYFDKSSAMISNLVNKIWFRKYPHCREF
jgi:hypothetical protein